MHCRIRISRLFIFLLITYFTYGLHNNYNPIHYKGKVLAYDGNSVKLIEESEIDTCDLLEIFTSGIHVLHTANNCTWGNYLELTRRIQYVDGVALALVARLPGPDDKILGMIINGRYIRGKPSYETMGAFYYLGHDMKTNTIQWYKRFIFPPENDDEEISWDLHPDILIKLSNICDYYFIPLDHKITTYKRVSINQTLYFHSKHLLSEDKHPDVSNELSIFKFNGNVWRSSELFLYISIGTTKTIATLEMREGLPFVPQMSGQGLVAISKNRKFELVVRTDIPYHPIYIRHVEFDWNSPDIEPLPLDIEFFTTIPVTHLFIHSLYDYKKVDFSPVDKGLRICETSHVIAVKMTDDGIAYVSREGTEDRGIKCDTRTGYWICTTVDKKTVQLMRRKGHYVVLFKLLSSPLPPSKGPEAEL